jgi:hypothetical protein
VAWASLPNTVSLDDFDDWLTKFALGPDFKPTHWEFGSRLLFDGAGVAFATAVAGLGLAKMVAHLLENSCSDFRGKKTGLGLFGWI